jgi:hypothetical protein
MARMVHCVKLNKEAEGLDFPPLPGELGKKIWQSVSKEAWAGGYARAPVPAQADREVLLWRRRRPGFGLRAAAVGLTCRSRQQKSRSAQPERLFVWVLTRLTLTRRRPPS